MLIKQFSKKYHVANDTVRYYEKEGLLKPERLENGYRLYNKTCEYNMKFILVLKQLGFTLQEIKLLMTLGSREPSHACNVESTTLFENKIAALESKIAFFTLAVQSLQQTYTLMEQGKYVENKDKIEMLMLEMYETMEEGME